MLSGGGPPGRVGNVARPGSGCMSATPTSVACSAGYALANGEGPSACSCCPAVRAVPAVPDVPAALPAAVLSGLPAPVWEPGL